MIIIQASKHETKKTNVLRYFVSLSLSLFLSLFFGTTQKRKLNEIELTI